MIHIPDWHNVGTYAWNIIMIVIVISISVRMCSGSIMSAIKEIKKDWNNR